MSDTIHLRPLPRDDLAQLVASVPKPEFTDNLLKFVRQSADIANVGAFYVADMSHPAPVLSLWAGHMSSYWFNRNARAILSNDRMMGSILKRIQAAQLDQLAIERWRPSPNDPITPIYMRDEVIERVTVSSRSGRIGMQSFYLRGKEAGWFSDAEIDRLQTTLPLVHELIGLRHRIVGSTAFQHSALTRISALRDRDTGPFGTLSPREAQVCDHVLQGVSVAGTALELGIAENTVRTLRRRAYAKLGVHSATQIAAMILNNQA